MYSIDKLLKQYDNDKDIDIIGNLLYQLSEMKENAVYISFII